MNPNEPIQQVQKAATVADIVNDHMGNEEKRVMPLSGYQIAEKYGLDPERVKEVLAKADANLDFVPADKDGNKIPPVDSLYEPIIAPLKEGENPEVGKVKGHK